MTDSFSRNIGISLAGHGLLLMLIFVRAVFIPNEPIEIRSAIRVDVVDLPRKMTEEQMTAPLPPAASVDVPAPKPVAKPEPAKAEPAKPEPVKLNKPDAKTKSKPDLAKAQSEALNKLKKNSALDEIQKEVDRAKASEAAAKAAKAAAAARPIAGNQISEGNSFTGMAKIDYDKYLGEIKDKIRAQWSIPQWLLDGGFKAQVQVLIDERGFVTKKIMRRPSGNDIFDGQVMEAIDGSSPLPAPPARLQGQLSTSGIILNFPE